MSTDTAERYSENESGWTRISSPRPRNSVLMSDDSIFELEPVTYTSRFSMWRNPFSAS